MKNKLSSYTIGLLAEETALQFLLSHKLRLLTRNYRTRKGEIDLILNDKDDIVFVEVRSRSRYDYGTAAETINSQKKQKLIMTARHFLQKRNLLYRANSRFDVVAIQFQNDKTEIEWLKNAFTVDDVCDTWRRNDY